jgi:O-antigen/teichoic acid export membrane protein
MAMEEPLSLRKNFCWTFAGSLIASGCQWAMLMVIAKLLSATEMGYYVLGLAVTAPVVLCSMLQLRAVQVTDAQDLHAFEDFFGVRLATNCGAIVVICAILAGLTGRYDFRVYVVILLIGVNKIIESTSDIAYGLMQKHERLDKVAQSMVLRNIGALVLFAVAVKITGSLIFGVASAGIWWLLVLFLFDRRNVERFGRFRPRFDLRAMLSIMRLGLPLGIATGIMSANSNMTRYFVEGYLGSESLGYFGAMAFVVIGASRATMALGQSASARLARYYVSNRKAYVRLLGKALGVASILAVAAILFGVYLGKPFLSIVYTPKYAEQHVVFVWLLVATGGAMLASMLGYGMTATRRFKSQIPVFMVSCGVSALGSWLLIPRYGMKGAAWAMLAATVMQCFGSLVVISLALRSPMTCGGDDKGRYEGAGNLRGAYLDCTGPG